MIRLARKLSPSLKKSAKRESKGTKKQRPSSKEIRRRTKKVSRVKAKAKPKDRVSVKSREAKKKDKVKSNKPGTIATDSGELVPKQEDRPFSVDMAPKLDNVEAEDISMYEHEQVMKGPRDGVKIGDSTPGTG